MSDQGIVPSPETITPPPAPNTIFRGPNGIRAGWRALIFLAIVVALFAALFVALNLLVRGNVQLDLSQLTPLGLGLTEGALFAFTAIAALVMARIERRPWASYGLPGRLAFRKDFWIGTVAGFMTISTILLCIFAFHGFRLTGIAIYGTTVATAFASWGATFVVVGLSEEFAFRGYLQFTLTTGIGYWPSAFLLSGLFGLAHIGNPGETTFGLLSVVCFGLLFCFILRRMGNLWWLVGFHAGFDWGQTFFYGVRDSGIVPYHNLLNSDFSGPRWLTGGSVGPEASIFTPLTLLLVAILFSRFYRENRYLTN